MNPGTDLNPIADNLFRQSADGLHLIGGRCTACGNVMFPVRGTCARCQSESVAEELLPRRGKVWTWTTQSFLPKAPYAGPESEEDFGGFVVGYVDLPGACIVQGRIDVPIDRAAELAAIGTDVETVAVEFNRHGSESPIHTYAFRPVAAEEGR
ncbi:zinc ribbon domain-containing protein [Mycolicibacterium thermoresistibile]